MKLLQMPSKKQVMDAGTAGQDGVLAQVWATDGALAHALAPIAVAAETAEDRERCIRELSMEQQRLILRVGVQEYTFEEAAQMFRLSLRSLQRRYFQALDELTSIFLRKKLLERIASDPC